VDHQWEFDHITEFAAFHCDAATLEAFRGGGFLHTKVIRPSPRRRLVEYCHSHDGVSFGLHFGEVWGLHGIVSITMVVICSAFRTAFFDVGR